MFGSQVLEVAIGLVLLYRAPVDRLAAGCGRDAAERGGAPRALDRDRHRREAENGPPKARSPSDSPSPRRPRRRRSTRTSRRQVTRRPG